jgi:hypothetical protein
MITICNIYNYSDREKQLLPHFINHYRDKLQLEIIFCVSEQNIEFQKYCQKNNLGYKIFDNFDSSKTFGYQDSCRINFVKNEIDCWYIPVDLDEFIYIENNDHILRLQKQCVDTDAKYVTGFLVDRLCVENTIKPKIDPDTLITDQFPVKSYITRNIMSGCVYKVLLASPDISVSAGHHWPIYKDNKKATHLSLKDSVLPIYHYKWFGNILELEYSKYIIRNKYTPEFAPEQKKLLDYFDAWPKN